MLSVMLVDDERLERTFLRKILEKHQDEYHVVTETGDGDEAVRLADIHKPDIVIIDINMPGRNGLEAAREIKQRLPNTIIILNSAYSEFRFAKQALEYDLDAYLVKPSQEEEIINTILGCKQRKTLSGAGDCEFTYDIHKPTKFPFDITSRLIQNISRKNVQVVKECLLNLIQVFKVQQQLSDYRLYIINTIFSIEHTLQGTDIHPNLIALLDSQRYLQAISRSTQWYDILSDTEEYFARLVLLLESTSKTQASSEQCLQTIIEYIDNHYQEEIQLEDLGKLVYLSPSYVSRLFRQEKGVSPRQYINGKRMEQAQHLLLHSDLSIQDVAEQCGYNNISHFYRVFKEYADKSPARYRKARN